MSETDAWEQPASPTTIQALREFCEKLVKERQHKKEVEEELSAIEGTIKELKTKILVIMKENAMPNFKGEFGTISIKNTKSISQPESLEEKLKLFEYLRSQDIFEEMVSVNARTLSSWANKEIEAKEKQGVFGWVPPGLKPPETFTDISVRGKNG